MTEASWVSIRKNVQTVVWRERLQLDLRKNFQVLIQSKRVQANVRTAMVELQRIV